MLNTFKTLQTIKSSTVTNLIIYYLQKLPLVKRVIKDELYANLSGKQAIAIIVFIIRIIASLLLRMLYVGLLIYFPIQWLSGDLPKEIQWQQFVHIFFMISFLVAGVSSATILEPKREKYVAIKLFRISPDAYMRNALVLRYLSFFIYLLPVMFLFGRLLQGSYLQIILLCLLATLWRIATEYMHLKLFERTKCILIKQVGIVWLVIGLGYLGAFLPLYLSYTPPTYKLLLHPLAFILIGAVGGAAALSLNRYRNYRAITDAATKRDDPYLNVGQMVSDAQKTSVGTKDSDYTRQSADGRNVNGKEGFSYLNALFFARHHSIVTAPYYKRLAITGIAGLILLAGSLLFQQQLANIQIQVKHILPFLLMTMYFLLVGDKLCKAIFYHCDISMLRYSFYRRAAYEHFYIRFIKVIKQNTVISTLLAVALTSILTLTGTELWSKDIAYLWICIYALTLFYSIHHLFMYYIFQPYTTELNIKNPLYHFISSFVSALSTIVIFIRPEPKPFVIFMTLLAIIYAINAFILVRKRGHLTFKLK